MDRRRALIVDDHASFRLVAAELLADEGYDVVGEAEDADSALRAARALAPDLILLDVQLPDNDGFFVAGQLAEEEHPPRIVLVSSRLSSDYGPRLDGPGITGFIPKSELSTEALQAVLTG